MRERYAICWGNEGENVVEFDPLDAFSVPPGLMRRVQQLGDRPGLLTVIYNNMNDPNTGITVLQSVIDADRAAGRAL